MSLRNPSNERGASIIEFALVAFVFFLIMWGIFEFGRAFYVRNSLQHLTRCIAREAVVLKPSLYTTAKERCLLNNTWPFYQLAPTDLRSAFTIVYVTDVANGTGLSEAAVAGGSYDPGSGVAGMDQLLVCPSGANCIQRVDVRLNTDSDAFETYQQFGLLKAWLPWTGEIFEPPSTTSMPAEALGFNPPSP